MAEANEIEVVSRNLQTYLEIARALNLLPACEELTVEDLADEAKVSWITAKKAVHFFYSLRPILPTISLTDQGGFRIIEKPSAWSAIGALEAPEMRVLAKLAMLGISEPKQAVYLAEVLSEDESDSLPRLVAEGMLVGLENGRYFLSSRGITIGATGLRRIMEMGIEIPEPSKVLSRERDEAKKRLATQFGKGRTVQSLRPGVLERTIEEKKKTLPAT